MREDRHLNLLYKPYDSSKFGISQANVEHPSIADHSSSNLLRINRTDNEWISSMLDYRRMDEELSRSKLDYLLYIIINLFAYFAVQRECEIIENNIARSEISLGNCNVLSYFQFTKKKC